MIFSRKGQSIVSENIYGLLELGYNIQKILVGEMPTKIWRIINIFEVIKEKFLQYRRWTVLMQIYNGKSWNSAIYLL